jgi:predicted aconitase with swiveling domain
MGKMIRGRCVVPGKAEGEIVVSSLPISFWGGVDPSTGRVNDSRHPLFGTSVSGKILAFPFGKGSSTGSLIILELARIGRAPAAIVNIRTEPILATGPIVSRHFYGKSIPVLTLDEASFRELETGVYARIDAEKGWIEMGEGRISGLSPTLRPIRRDRGRRKCVSPARRVRPRQKGSLARHTRG